MNLYTKPHCDKCEDIKSILQKNNVTFTIKDTKDPVVLNELRPLLAGLENPILPIISFDDGTIVANNMGLYKALREKGIIKA